MDVLEAIRSRRSIRAFKPDPIPQETVAAILDISQRSPSGTNTQPWRVYVCAGAVKEAISRDVLDLVRSGKGQTYDELGYYPKDWKPEHNARRRGIGWALYGLLGIQKGDRDGTRRQMERNFVFFDAPVGLFITTDTYLGVGSWADAGMYAQTIMLAARGFGLDTCPQAAWIPFQDPIRQHLGIPDDQVIVTGMSLGRAEPGAIENTLVSDRERLEDVARFVGFE